MEKQIHIRIPFQRWPVTMLLFILIFFSTLTAIAQWEQTNLSEGKYFIGATSLDSKAYFAGGQLCGTNSFSSKVEIYDAAMDTWDPPQELSVGRALIAAAATENKVLFAGGAIFNWPASKLLSEVDILDVSACEWTVEHLSVPRMTSAVSKGDIVLFAGGISEIIPATKFTNIVDIYDAQTGTWTIDSLSEARDARAAVVVGDLAMFAGGYNGQTVSNTVDIYHFSTGEWTMDTLSLARGFLAATASGNKAYFAGGVTRENLSSDIVDVYDSKTGEWSVEHLWFPRSFLGNTNSTTVFDRAFFINGGLLNLNNLSWSIGYDIVDNYSQENGWGVFFLTRHKVNHTVVGIESGEIGQVLVAGGVPSCGTLVDRYVLTTTNQETFGDPKIEYTIVPNPASSHLNINVTFPHKTDGFLTLFNITGKALFQQKFDVTDIDHQIDVSSYPPGIYLLEVRTDTGRIIEKVVVNE